MCLGHIKMAVNILQVRRQEVKPELDLILTAFLLWFKVSKKYVDQLCILNSISLDQVWSILPALGLLPLNSNSRGWATPMQAKWIKLDLPYPSDNLLSGLTWLNNKLETVMSWSLLYLHIPGWQCSSEILAYIDMWILLLHSHS